MSILNIHLERDLAIVTSNTQIALPDGSMHQAGKLFTLPAVNCVIAGRGDVGVMLNLYAQSFTLMRDFDGMAETLESLTSSTIRNMHQFARQQGTPLPICTEIALVGRSKSRREMACHYVKCDGAGTIETVVDVRGGMIAPADLPWRGTRPEPKDREGLIALARQQAQLAEEFHPGQCWRGDLMTAEITADSIKLTTVREFWQCLEGELKALQ